MTHPTRELWMSYLYDEVDAQQRGTLAQHLDHCAECRAQVAAWQATRRRLDLWNIAPRRAAVPAWQTWTRWAAAAMVVLGCGFALGRVTGASKAEVAALRTQVAQLNAQTPALVRDETQRQLREFATGVDAQLTGWQTQHARDYSALRKDLETVAVFTEANFNRTQNQLVQLAGYTGNPAGDGR